MKRFLGIIVLLAGFATPVQAQAPAAQNSEPEQLVEDAAIVMQGFINSSQFKATPSLLQESKALVIIPNHYRIGFLLGASRGTGIITQRLDENLWSAPAFLNMYSGNVGLLAGASASEIILFVMTDAGMEEILDRNVRGGGQAGIAIATLGAEIGGATAVGANADIVVYGRSVGFYAGVSLEASTFDDRGDLAAQYYGKYISFMDILRGNASNAQASVLWDKLKPYPAAFSSITPQQ